MRISSLELQLNRRNKMEYSILTLTFCVGVITVCAQIPGELNARCRTINECRDFGYLCAKNRTCQCLRPLYVPNASGQKCVGIIDQRCQYDEHCIEGAFCLNQSKCKCKESFHPDEDGLLCSNARSNTLGSREQLILPCIIFYMLNRYL